MAGAVGEEPLKTRAAMQQAVRPGSTVDYTNFLEHMTTPGTVSSGTINSAHPEEGVSFRVQFHVESGEVIARLLVDQSDFQLLGSVLTMAWKLTPIDLLESLLDQPRLNQTELFLISYNDADDEDEAVGVNVYEDEQHLVETPEFFLDVVIELARAQPGPGRQRPLPLVPRPQRRGSSATGRLVFPLPAGRPTRRLQCRQEGRMVKSGQLLQFHQQFIGSRSGLGHEQRAIGPDQKKIHFIFVENVHFLQFVMQQQAFAVVLASQ